MIFPAPPPSYNTNHANLYWLPKPSSKQTSSLTRTPPRLLFPNPSSKHKPFNLFSWKRWRYQLLSHLHRIHSRRTESSCFVGWVSDLWGLQKRLSRWRRHFCGFTCCLWLGGFAIGIQKIWYFRVRTIYRIWSGLLFGQQERNKDSYFIFPVYVY